GCSAVRQNSVPSLTRRGRGPSAPLPCAGAAGTGRGGGAGSRRRRAPPDLDLVLRVPPPPRPRAGPCAAARLAAPPPPPRARPAALAARTGVAAAWVTFRISTWTRRLSCWHSRLGSSQIAPSGPTAATFTLGSGTPSSTRNCLTASARCRASSLLYSAGP